MKFLTIAILLGLAGVAAAFPPAPHHEVYGMVRDETGTPLSGGATVRLNGPSGTVVSGLVDPEIEPGINYSLKVPMDAGTQAQLYKTTALLATTPYTMELVLGGTSYVPIEVQGAQPVIGAPGGRTRLDLTLGVDSDGDGLPDAWEQSIITATSATSLEDVTPDGDSDRDGVSNHVEYLVGTYAFTNLVVFRLEVVEVKNGLARLRFLATKGRSYSILSSGDGETFTDTLFSLHADGSEEMSVFRSERIRYEEVYIPAAEVDTKLFRLHVH